MSWLALLIYAGWTYALLLAIGALRVYLSATGRRAPNRFAPSGDDVSPFSGRLCRAHANCYENLPIFAVLVLVAAHTDQLSVTDPWALPLVAARIAQSSIHIISTSVRAVTLRFVFFAIQMLIIGGCLLGLAGPLLES